MLPERCVSELFVIIFDHKNLRIMWRGGDESDDDVTIPADHESLDVLNAIKDASCQLYEGCHSADKRKKEDPRVDTDGSCKGMCRPSSNLEASLGSRRFYQISM